MRMVGARQPCLPGPWASLTSPTYLSLGAGWGLRMPAGGEVRQRGFGAPGGGQWYQPGTIATAVPLSAALFVKQE